MTDKKAILVYTDVQWQNWQESWQKKLNTTAFVSFHTVEVWAVLGFSVSIKNLRKQGSRQTACSVHCMTVSRCCTAHK